jgi:pilus assembly protein CpaB
MFAAGTTLFVRNWLGQQARFEATRVNAPAKPATKSVLVAAKPLATGDFVQSDAVRWQEWPDVGVPESYFVEGQRGIDEVAGAVLRRPLAEGEPVNDGNLVKPGERGFLAAVLDPGMRAVSVPVDETAASAGLIFPGDRVDLVLTQALAEEEKAGAQRRVSETVLEDVRILAMGRRLRTEEGEEGSGGQAKTATLEVTRDGAEKVALVTELGKISLSLRSLATGDLPTGEPEAGFRATWDSDVSPVLRPENQPRTTMAVIRGQQAQTVTTRRGNSP